MTHLGDTVIQLINRSVYSGLFMSKICTKFIALVNSYITVFLKHVIFQELLLNPLTFTCS